jgi:hypothetical protein
MTPQCTDQVRLGIGAYALGALEEPDRRQVEAHLAVCGACRAELADLAQLPAMLALVDPDELVDAEPAPARRFRRPRLGGLLTRRRLPKLAVAAAVAVAVLAGAGTALLPQSAGDLSRTVRVADTRTRVVATVQVRPTAWGTAVQLRMHGVTPGERCRLVAVSRSGGQEVIGSWRVTYEGRADVAAPTAVPLADLAALRVLGTDGQPLITAQL